MASAIYTGCIEGSKNFRKENFPGQKKKKKIERKVLVFHEVFFKGMKEVGRHIFNPEVSKLPPGSLKTFY